MRSVTRSGATLRTVHIAYPIRDAGDVVEPIVRALTPRTKLVVIDHVTAQTALVLPVAAIAAECRARGVPVLVDGAHVPGSRPLDIPSLGVDWYSGNLHKWAHAPRGCGILWAAPEQAVDPSLSGRVLGPQQRLPRRVRAHRHLATRRSYLAAPEGIAVLREWDFDACVKYMHGLAWEAAGILTERWGTTFEIPRDMVGTMVTVPLPRGRRRHRRGRGAPAPCAARRGAHRSPAPRVARPPLDQGLGADLQRSDWTSTRLADAVTRRS